MDTKRIPDDVWENRCRWCVHRTKGVEKNRDVERWEPLSSWQSVRETIPCQIFSVTQYDFGKIPGECRHFAPNHIFGICYTCKWNNSFHEPSYCLFSDQPETRQVYVGNTYGGKARRYWEHTLCTCDNYGPDPAWVPWMMQQAAEGKIPKNFDPETMEAIGEHERNEVAEKWAEIDEARAREEQEAREKKWAEEEIQEAMRTGQLPGQMNMFEV